MPKTEVRGGQIRDATVGRSDVNADTPGEAVVRKIVPGTGISLSSTGADVGTGDVTISASGGGAPALHAGTHNVVGSDPVSLTTLAGYPGNSAVWLSGTGAFTSPLTGANIAFTNINNNWTSPQWFTDATQVRGNNSLFFLNSTGSASTLKVWRYINYGDGVLNLEAMSDDGNTTIFGTIQFTRTGGVQATSLLGTPLNATNLTSGTIPDARLSSNVALKNIDNNFVSQTLGSNSRIFGVSSALYFNDTNAGVNLKIWRFLNFSDGPLVLQAVTDDFTAAQTSYSFSRAGVFAANVIRSSQHWFDPVVSSSNDRTLDDYLEYPWTPSISIAGGVGGIAYGHQSGTIVKVGQMVTVTFRINISVLTSPASGGVTIDNCPITVGAYQPVGIIMYFGLAAAVSCLVCSIAPGSTVIYPFYGNNTGSMAQLTGNMLAAGTDLYGSIQFRANA